MRFCDTCGQLLRPNKQGEDVIISCANGCTTLDKKEAKKELIVESSVNVGGDNVEIIVSDKDAPRRNPTMERYCKRCDENTVTEYWQIQTRSADESPTRFYRCTKCKLTQREYD